MEDGQVYIAFNTASIEQIESGLDITLPPGYRYLLLSYPFAADPEPYGWEMFGHVNTIIGENRIYRENGFAGARWPPHYLIIGEDGYGSLYFLDFSRNNEIVSFADHEATLDAGSVESYQETSTLAEWIRQMKEEQEKEASS